MHKPGFGVVTTVITILAIFAFAARSLVGSIPDAPQNALATEAGDYVQQGSRQQIQWRVLNEDAFREARRLDRPLMVVVGSACSWNGRSADRSIFTSQDVRSVLARSFISVRVDAMEYPEMMAGYLPLSRALLNNNESRLAIPYDFAVWFLDPRGHLLDWLAQTDTRVPLTPRLFISRLTRIQDWYDNNARKGKSGELQRAELDTIRADLPPSVPDPSAYLTGLARVLDTTYGGFPINGYQRLWPNAWRLQLLGGRLADYTQGIVSLLSSPMFDPLDGGFFSSSGRTDWTGVSYDKVSLENAGMLVTLATGAKLQSDAVQAWFYARTFDGMIDTLNPDGFIAAGQVGDEKSVSRSARYSFPPKALREIFPDPTERERARELLGLRVEDNPQMSPRLADVQSPLTRPDEMNALLDKLGKDRPEAKLAGERLLDNAAFCTARMLEASRIMGDSRRNLRAQGLYERLDEFRIGDDVVHSIVPGRMRHAYLGDYLAFADASLQYYLSTGNQRAFDTGVAVLRRGLFLYGGKTSGSYRLVQEAISELAPQDIDAPEIIDGLRESCTAQVIRLAQDYGRLLGPKGADLKSAAADAVTRFSNFVPLLVPHAAGFYCAALSVSDSTFALVSGPNAVRDANVLAGLVPGRLVAPAVGTIPGSAKPAGIYVIGEIETTGPLDSKSAAEALRLPPF